MFPTLAQAAPSPLPISTGTSASNIFYLTLLFIFLTGIVTALVTKWAKDKCLKLFHGYHVTVERLRGQTIWGTLRVFSSGLEVVYDHAFPDHRGRRKTSYLLYQQEVEQQTLSIFRYPAELNERAQRARQRQVQRTFNPGPIRRFTRAIRNLVNTLRDAFSASIGAVIGQYQRMNPASMVLGTQGTQVTQIGQTLLSRFANRYIRLVTRLKVRDCTTGYRCWRRAALADLPLDRISSDGYSFLVETLYMAARGGARLFEEPITFVERRQGESKLSGAVIFESVLMPWRLIAAHERE